MKKDFRRGYFPIPNLTSCFQILLLPLYLFLCISFTFRYPKMVLLLVLFLCKELCLGILGLWMIKKGHGINGAGWHGKLCTTVLGIVLLLMLLIPDLGYFKVNLMIYLCAAVMIFSWCCYLKLYYHIWRYDIRGKEPKEPKKKNIGIVTGLLVTFFLLYLAVGAIAPFTRQPKISKDTETAFQKQNYYSDQTSADRAHVISDNEEALRERIRLISEAKERIILSTFEFRSDESGTQMLAALLDAAKRGVKVSVLCDGVGAFTRMDGNPYFYALAAEPNAVIKIYSPVRPWMPWTFMGRMHDKYLAVDEKAYILGGRNTYDFFLGGQPGYKNYDWDMLVYNTSGKEEESSLSQIISYFDQIWGLSACVPFQGTRLMEKTAAVQKARSKLEQRYIQMKEEHPDWFSSLDYKEITKPVHHIELISNPTHIWSKEPVAFYQLTRLMENADHEVVFHTPYIICNDWMLDSIKKVCQNVDTVQMMTNSVANNGNPFGAMDYQANKGKLLDAGIWIMEYDSGVSYHGKCLTIDDRLAILGSFNMDMRSAYVDTELMLAVDSTEVTRELRTEMERYESDALTVLDKDHAAAPEGMTAQTLSTKRKIHLKFLHIFLGWARFLM